MSHIPHNSIDLYYLDTGILGWIPKSRTSNVTVFCLGKTAETKIKDKADPAPLPPRPTVTPVKKPKPKVFKIAMTPSELKATMDAELQQIDAGLPPEIPVSKTIGKLGLMQPQLPNAKNHPALPLLETYASKGCPVDCGCAKR